MKQLNKINLEDLTEEQKDIAEIIGLDAYIRLSKLCGGSYIYVPMIESLERIARNSNIRNEFTGFNLKKLARKYHLTEVSIRSIVNTKEE